MDIGELEEIIVVEEPKPETEEIPVEESPVEVEVEEEAVEEEEVPV